VGVGAASVAVGGAGTDVGVIVGVAGAGASTAVGAGRVGRNGSVGALVGVATGAAPEGVGVEVEVEVAVGIAVGTPATQELAPKVVLSNVTAPVRASARPFMRVPLFNVMLELAMMVPSNVVVVPRTAALPICQNTLHGVPPVTLEPDEVVRVLPVRKIYTAFGSTVWSVRLPVSSALDVKQ
jgi:hypothetical protein